MQRISFVNCPKQASAQWRYNARREFLIDGPNEDRMAQSED